MSAADGTNSDVTGPRATPAATEIDLSERNWTLPDGTRVCLDLLGRADRADLLAGFAELSRRSRYLRFFSAMNELPADLIDRLLDTDPHRHVAIGARLLSVNEDVEAPLVGVARYFRMHASSESAEVELVVADAMHERGLGHLLLHVITAHAGANGVAMLRAYALAENLPMRHLLLESHGVLVERDGPVELYHIGIDAHTVAPASLSARPPQLKSEPGRK